MGYFSRSDGKTDIQWLVKVISPLELFLILSQEALCVSQANMKKRFAVERQFQPGVKGLVLLPVPNSALITRFSGPYVIVKKVSDTNYFSQHPRTQEEDSPMPC